MEGTTEGKLNVSIQLLMHGKKADSIIRKKGGSVRMLAV